MWEWLKQHAGVVPCELDTVIGSISGKVLFTMVFPNTGLALSHLDSYPRESLGGRTPYDVFVEKHGAEGKAFLDALGIVRIPSNQVTLHPFLLGQKYQRAADRAILKKYGVIAKKPESNK